MRVKVHMNQVLVNTIVADKKGGAGRIGFQAHDVKGEVHFKDIKWHEKNEN
jgi:hypothetical protein